jgi:hypothetical protein
MSTKSNFIRHEFMGITRIKPANENPYPSQSTSIRGQELTLILL